MNPMIEFCVSNIANCSQQAFEQLQKDPNLDVLEYGCTSHCSICSQSLFAVVNGDVIRAETNDDLIEKVYKHIEENPMF